MIEAMKRDLVDVISRYVEVDREKIDVSFERQDRTLAMLANIPILAVSRPSANGNGTRKPEQATPPIVAAAAPAATAAPAAKPPVASAAGARRRKAPRPLPAQAPASRRRVITSRLWRQARSVRAPCAMCAISTGSSPWPACSSRSSVSSAFARPDCTRRARRASSKKQILYLALGDRRDARRFARRLSNLATLGAGTLRRQPALAALYPARRS